MLLGLRSFDNLKGPLAHKHASFPIIFGGIEFISTSTIAPNNLFRELGPCNSIITARFMMVNQHPSFLKLWRKLTITPSLSNNTSKHDVIFYHLQHEHLSLLLNNSSDNIWFIFKIPFQNICTIMSFLT